MNIYRTEFFSTCPTNGVRVKYQLTIESDEVLPVEQIVAKVEQFDGMFHEEIADALHAAFNGRQTLIADHHSVTIETKR